MFFIEVDRSRPKSGFLFLKNRISSKNNNAQNHQKHLIKFTCKLNEISHYNNSDLFTNYYNKSKKRSAVISKKSFMTFLHKKAQLTRNILPFYFN